MQLVANSGAAENIWINDNPEITFFKQIFRRHTPFAIESIKLPLNLDFNSSDEIKLNVNGDLIYKIFLRFDIPEISAYFDDKITDIHKILTPNFKDLEIDRLFSSIDDSFIKLNENKQLKLKILNFLDNSKNISIDDWISFFNDYSLIYNFIKYIYSIEPNLLLDQNKSKSFDSNFHDTLNNYNFFIRLFESLNSTSPIVFHIKDNVVITDPNYKQNFLYPSKIFINTFDKYYPPNNYYQDIYNDYVNNMFNNINKSIEILKKTYEINSLKNYNLLFFDFFKNLDLLNEKSFIKYLKNKLNLSFNTTLFAEYLLNLLKINLEFYLYDITNLFNDLNIPDDSIFFMRSNIPSISELFDFIYNFISVIDVDQINNDLDVNLSHVLPHELTNIKYYINMLYHRIYDYFMNKYNKFNFESPYISSPNKIIDDYIKYFFINDKINDYNLYPQFTLENVIEQMEFYFIAETFYVRQIQKLFDLFITKNILQSPIIDSILPFFNSAEYYSLPINRYKGEAYIDTPIDERFIKINNLNLPLTNIPINWNKKTPNLIQKNEEFQTFDIDFYKIKHSFFDNIYDYPIIDEYQFNIFKLIHLIVNNLDKKWISISLSYIINHTEPIPFINYGNSLNLSTKPTVLDILNLYNLDMDNVNLIQETLNVLHELSSDIIINKKKEPTNIIDKLLRDRDDFIIDYINIKNVSSKEIFDEINLIFTLITQNKEVPDKYKPFVLFYENKNGKNPLIYKPAPNLYSLLDNCINTILDSTIKTFSLDLKELKKIIEDEIMIIDKDIEELINLKNKLSIILYRNKKAKTAWIRKLGHYLVKDIILKMDNKVIDHHTSDWLEIYHEISKTKSQDYGYNKMIGNVDELTVFNDKTKKLYTLTIPLIFYFNKNIGLSLPLMNNIKYTINIKLRSLEDVMYKEEFSKIKGNPKITNAHLMVDYIYLGEEERQIFLEKQLEYLIDEIQINKHKLNGEVIDNYIYKYEHKKDKNGLNKNKLIKNKSKIIKMEYQNNFSNPVKFLSIVIRSSNHINLNRKSQNYFFNEKQWDNYSLYPYYDHSNIIKARENYYNKFKQMINNIEDETFGFINIINNLLITDPDPIIMKIKDLYLEYEGIIEYNEPLIWLKEVLIGLSINFPLNLFIINEVYDKLNIKIENIDDILKNNTKEIYQNYNESIITYIIKDINFETDIVNIINYLMKINPNNYIKIIKEKIDSLSNDEIYKINNYKVNNLTFKDIINQINKHDTIEDIYNNIIPNKKINEITKKMVKKQNEMLDKKIELINYEKNLIENPKINPLIKGYITIDDVMIMPESDNIIWSELESYKYFKSTPNNGINLHSWSLYPLDIQPSGYINLTKIDNMKIHLEIDGDIDDAKIINIALSINMMRYFKGLGGKAWL